MIDMSPLWHAFTALAVQCFVGLMFGAWATGGAMGCIWFIAREHTQAEYRWIALFGRGHRANMPWWGGFDWRAWDCGSLLDWLVPVTACAAAWFVIG